MDYLFTGPGLSYESQEVQEIIKRLTFLRVQTKFITKKFF